MIQRAYCEAIPYEADGMTFSEDVSGRVTLSQIIDGDDEGVISVRARWRDVDVSDSYGMCLADGLDCTGAGGPMLEDGATVNDKGK